MKTLQEQYNLIQEGKGSKHIFLKEAKNKFPDMITNAATFEETAQILKNRSVISETLGGVVSLQPVTPLESNTKEDFEIAYAKFLAEEAKAEEKKATKEVEEAETAGYDYKNLKELDNQIGHEVLKGIYFEGRQNPDKTLEELRDMVAKNLAKDQLHYKKNAYFGIEGLGLEEMKAEEVSGKHKSSGYSDKLKSLVKESLGAVISNVPVFEDENGYNTDPNTTMHIDDDEWEKEMGRGVKETKPKKKMKKETIETKLAEIEKAGKVTTLEAQIAAIEEAISEKQERLTLVNEDSEMAELLDKGKVNAMRKEIKVLEKRTDKMKKMYEKMCGKSYQKPITDDMDLGGEAPAFE